MVRELGLERRETVWSLSTVSTKNLTEEVLCTKGPVTFHHLFAGCFSKAAPGSYMKKA